jgi:hypothetical protein
MGVAERMPVSPSPPARTLPYKVLCTCDNFANFVRELFVNISSEERLHFPLGRTQTLIGRHSPHAQNTQTTSLFLSNDKLSWGLGKLFLPT